MGDWISEPVIVSRPVFKGRESAKKQLEVSEQETVNPDMKWKLNV